MTFLRWAGSKKQILSVLSSCWYAATNDVQRSKTRYIEGFSGSASLFFHLQPAKALLVDINQDLQQCFRRVKSEPKGVALALHKFSCTEKEYYRIRAIDKTNISPNERAAIFIYLNRNCFNGLYRTNSQGVFNVPFGGARAGALPSYAQLLNASKKLKNAEIVSGDFFNVISNQIKKNDFLYLDPPYAKRNVDLDNQYGPDVFGNSDISRLGTLLDLTNSRGGHFLVSYANCEEITEISNRWHTHTVSVRRTIAANTAKRVLAEELLITNL